MTYNTDAVIMHRVRDWRKAHGITQRKFSLLITRSGYTITPRQYSTLESGWQGWLKLTDAFVAAVTRATGLTRSEMLANPRLPNPCNYCIHEGNIRPCRACGRKPNRRP